MLLTNRGAGAMDDESALDKGGPRPGTLAFGVAGMIVAALLAINGYEAWMMTRHAAFLRQCISTTSDEAACVARARTEAPLPQRRRTSTSW